MASGRPPVPRKPGRSRAVVLAFALAALLIGAGSNLGGPDVAVDYLQPAASNSRVVQFELGSNELYDLFVEGGIDRSREMGVSRVRIWLGHRFLGTAVRSAAPFDFDWDLLFRYVQRVRDAGAIPHVSFVAAPSWIPAFDGRPSSQHESEVFDADGQRAFGDYAAEAVARLRQRFGPSALDWPYVIWNEPNNHQNAGSHYACGDGAGYLALFTQTRRALDARFGADRVRLGGPSLDAIDTGATLGPDGAPRCGSIPDLGWQAYLRAVDEGADFDFLTWHWYGMFRIGETDPQDVLLSRLRWFENRVHTLNAIAAGRPHFVEEINLNGDLAADPLIDEQVNAAFLASAMLRAIRQGASGMLVYKGSRAADGLTPGGEPDFGLWSNSVEGSITPAFRALRLFDRFVGAGGRLARVSVSAPDVDALALVGPLGPVLAVVNLSDEPRQIHITGVPAGPFVYADRAQPWGRDWFDGESLSLQAHAVAVVTADALGLSPSASVARGARAFANPSPGPACSACHATDAGGGPAPALAGAERHLVDGSHAAAGLSALERADIGDYLAGLRVDPAHRFTGVVRDLGGQPIAGAVVIAASGSHARVAPTDDAGRFDLKAPRGEREPRALPTEFVILHPEHRAVSQPTARNAVSSDRTDLVFELASRASDSRPLVATPHVVPSALPEVWVVGVATAGSQLTVWAIDDAAGLALRLAAVPDHPFGLHQALYGRSGLAPDARQWRFVAVSPDGVPSDVLTLPPATDSSS